MEHGKKNLNIERGQKKTQYRAWTKNPQYETWTKHPQYEVWTKNPNMESGQNLIKSQTTNMEKFDGKRKKTTKIQYATDDMSNMPKKMIGKFKPEG